MRLFLVKAREPIPISTRWPLEPTLSAGPGAFHFRLHGGFDSSCFPRSLSLVPLSMM